MRTIKIFLAMIVLFNTRFNLFSQTAEEWKKLGNAEFDSANYDKAIEYYHKAIETDSTYFDAYYNLGNVFAKIHNFDNAIEFFNKAITINDTDADAYFALGFVYSEKQDYENAIEMFKKGIQLQPNSPREYYYLGFFYQNSGSLVYSNMYAKKAAQLGDTLAQQLFIDNGISWEDNFEKPDYEQIKLNIENKQSNFYYSKILNRFQAGDSTMTLEEKRHLYYGYVFHKNYSPYADSREDKQVKAVLDKEKPTKKEWKKLVSLLNASLKAKPFSIKHLYYQGIAYDALNNLSEADKNIKKIRYIVDALNSTGDGLSKETAIHVITISNEYDYMFLNNLSMQSQALADGGYDVFNLQPNKDGLEEIWFDVNQPLNYLGKLFK